MKKTLKLIGLFVVMAMSVNSLNAQDSKKELSKEIKSKVEKECKKAAKSLTREGWKTMPGKLSIERQIQDGRFAEIEIDDLGDRVYFTASHSSIGGNYSSAKKIASNRVINELGEQVGVKVKSIVKDNASQSSFSDKDIKLINDCISVSKQTVSSRLSGAFPVVEIYREIGEGKLEVKMMYRINSKNALRMAKDIYHEELKRESSALAEKLDLLINKY